MLLTLPDDLLLECMLFLSLKQILNVSSTSRHVHKSCKFAIRKFKGISLILFDIGDDTKYIENSNIDNFATHISFSWHRVKHNEGIINFLKEIWQNVGYIDSKYYDLSQLIADLGLNCQKLQNLQLLSQPNYSYLNLNRYVAYLKNLEWINIPFIGKTIWNKLITECHNLHGISFNNYLCDKLDQNLELELAPNLWTLSMTNCTDLINEILKSAKNLKYLQIENTDDLNVKYIQLPKNLIALKLDFETLMEIEFDLSECNKLCYIDLRMSFLTEYIEENKEYHRRLSVLLLSFLDLDIYSKYTKQIGIKLEYENGTEYVSEQEKIAAITQFKSIMDESDIYRNFDKKKINIISTNWKSDLVELWTEKLFPISAENILLEDDTNIIVADILKDLSDLNEIEYPTEIMKYYQKFIDLEIEM